MQIDDKKIATEISQRAIDRIISLAETAVKKQWALYKNSLRDNFYEYIYNKLAWSARIKNLSFTSESGLFSDIYVKSYIHSIKHDFDDIQLTRYIVSRKKKNIDVDTNAERPTNAIVIRGIGGVGKSFLSRFLFRRVCSNHNSFIPLLIELRNINDYENISIEHIVRREFLAFGADISEERVAEGLRLGVFLLILDGYDELKLSRQDIFDKEIVKLSTAYAGTPVVITSRPEDILDTWPMYELFEVTYFGDERVQELVLKQNVDIETKRRFIKLIEDKLHETHEKYLEIPIFVVIMLLSFSETGRVSDRDHEFFSDAFEALWKKHDARKEGFSRPKYCGLEKDHFIKLLSALCAYAYVRDEYYFTPTSFSSYLNIAESLVGINVKEDYFLRDLLISVSILVRSDREIRFIHRSFQEYLTAVYFMSLGDIELFKALNSVASRFGQDKVLHMAHSIDSDRVELYWIEPNLRNFLPERYKKLSLDEYGEIYGAKSTTNQERSAVILSAIRGVMLWTPYLEDLRAAYDAAKNIFKNKNAQLNLKDHLNDDWGVFSADVRNFDEFREKLTYRLENRKEAVSIIFGTKDDQNS